MNLKKNNGFTGIDISIALIVLVIFLGTIATVIYNLDIQTKAVERKTEATSIIVDILEYAKSMNFYDLNIDKLNEYKTEKYQNLAGYTIEINCENDSDTLEIELKDSIHIGKKVTVNVKYLVGKNEQDLSMYTWILNN